MMSPLELERYFFTKVQINAVAESASKLPNLVSATVELAQKDDDPRRFLVKLNVTLAADPNETPNYRGEVSVVGFFRVHADYRNDPEQLAGVTGASILYNAVREMVANVTARGPWPSITLQSISFKDVRPSEPIKPVIRGPHSRHGKLTKRKTTAAQNS